MDPVLQEESARLQRSWAQRDPAELRDYLVSDVEDPRINLQSIFSRHFILRQIGGEKWSWLMREECRFSAVMNWLMELARHSPDAESLRVVRHALERGTDNAEGLPIPGFTSRAFKGLAADVEGPGLTPPNYVAGFLDGTQFEQSKPQFPATVMNSFCELWRSVLSAQGSSADKPSVLEPACGSANDYRFLHACGITDHILYAGFDLCEANVANARAMFPGVSFGVGNVFEIQAANRAYDLCFVHDLFEHLSLHGIEVAVGELCRVTRLGMCVGFFNMDEIPSHLVQPYEEYHWNRLSMDAMRAAFARQGFASRVRHIASFLREEVGCETFHNPGAYTFVLWRE